MMRRVKPIYWARKHHDPERADCTGRPIRHQPGSRVRSRGLSAIFEFYDDEERLTAGVLTLKTASQDVSDAGLATLEHSGTLGHCL